MENTVTRERLEKYFSVTKAALEEARKSCKAGGAETILDMAERYYSDALHFKEKGDWVTAFAALNYAHGWLDCGAMLGLLKVKSNELFTVD